MPAKKKDSLVLFKDYLLRSRTKKFVGEKKLPSLEFPESYPPSPLSRYLQWPQFSDQWFLLSHPTNAEVKEKKAEKSVQPITVRCPKLDCSYLVEQKLSHQ
jgi:hypothetical protein